MLVQKTKQNKQTKTIYQPTCFLGSLFGFGRNGFLLNLLQRLYYNRLGRAMTRSIHMDGFTGSFGEAASLPTYHKIMTEGSVCVLSYSLNVKGYYLELFPCFAYLHYILVSQQYLYI
jgi:hypothetical protein